MQLPLDILEVIVGLLDTQSSSTDICNCALAGRVLVPICQKRLLASVKLVQRVRRDGGGEFVVSTHPIDRFHNSLLQNPSMGAFVRELEIRCISRYNHPSDAGFAGLRLLGNVRSLKFGFTHGPTGSGWTRSWPESCLHGIKSALDLLIAHNPITSLYLFGIRDLAPSFISQALSLKHLTIQHLSLNASAVTPDTLMRPIQLDTLELLENTGDFVKQSISTPLPIIDASQVTRLTMDSTNSDKDIFLPVLSSLQAVEVLDLRMDNMMASDAYSWAEGKTLSKLRPSALRTLHMVKFQMYVLYTASDCPIFGGFAAELATVASRNNLREVSIKIEFGFGATLGFGQPGQWADLDQILSRGFPHLRKLYIKVQYTLWNMSDSLGAADAADAAQRAEAEWEMLFEEGFPWCRSNLHFITEVKSSAV
ncbi:hypothetical protein BKA70DRAFT_1564603 [Coprinopsis sp. MPI-PUGE-AT-0042]|nr:hypothetical protein BKA70DRAFT_1564603 [Coprinopsis sp. MPI-PUGE-AT-0042]